MIEKTRIPYDAAVWTALTQACHHYEHCITHEEFVGPGWCIEMEIPAMRPVAHDESEYWAEWDGGAL